MATRFQTKRSSVSGVVPTTGDITSGELAVNLADRRLFTSNGSAVFELGSNLTNLSVTANLVATRISLGNSTVNVSINSTAVTVSSDPLVQQSDVGTAPDQVPLNQYLGTLAYQSDTVAVANIFTIGTAAVFVANGNVGMGNTTPAHRLRVQGDISLSGGVHANGSLGTAGQVLHSNGTVAYWDTDDQGVTSVATGNGLTGGTITSTGTISVLANSGLIANATGLHVVAGNGITVNSTTVAVLANSGIVSNSTGVFANANTGLVSNATGIHVRANNGIIANATGVFVFANTGLVSNATGVHVNSAFIGTLTANNATNFNGQPASFYANATNLTTGTVNTALLPATANISTAINVGANVNLSTTSIRVGNSTVNVSINSTSITVTSDPLVQQSDVGTAPDQVPLNQYLGTLAYQSDTIAVSNTFSIGNAALFSSNGNVGIGNTSPAHKLRVEGDLSLSGGVHANGSLGTSGQVLTSNGSSVYWGNLFSPVLTSLTANVVTTSNVVSLVSELVAAVGTNQVWLVDVFGIYRSAATTTGIRLGISAPANSTTVNDIRVRQAADGTASIFEGMSLGNTTISSGAVTATNTDFGFTIRSMVRTGNTAGNVNLQLASEIDTSQITVMPGTTMIAFRLQ